MKARAKARYAYVPDVVYPPGETLAEWLDEIGLTGDDLAASTGMSPGHVKQVVEGTEPITDEFAHARAGFTGVPAEFWNRLEKLYRTALSAPHAVEAGNC